MKYLDLNGLRVLVSKIKEALGAKADVSYVDSKVKTDVPEGAVFTDTRTDISGKADKSEIPTRNSQLINDSDYVTSSELGDAGFGDMTKSTYDKDNSGIVDNAEKVNGFTVGVDVPADAKFTDTLTDITGKVDKVIGKELSENDFTNTLKAKLDGIAIGANRYTHPTKHPASIIAETASKRFVSDAEKIYWNKTRTDLTKHDANDNLIKHKANQISLADNNFTANTIEAGMGELFTNVSNGKDLVSRAITDVDESVTIPTDPSFNELADAVSGISAGKKWASGSTLASGNKINGFDKWGNAMYSYYINIGPLPFTPTSIIATQRASARDLSYSIYVKDWYNHFSETVVASYVNNTEGTTRTMTFEAKLGDFNISSTESIIPVYEYSTRYDWIAYE